MRIKGPVSGIVAGAGAVNHPLDRCGARLRRAARGPDDFKPVGRLGDSLHPSGAQHQNVVIGTYVVYCARSPRIGQSTRAVVAPSGCGRRIAAGQHDGAAGQLCPVVKGDGVAVNGHRAPLDPSDHVRIGLLHGIQPRLDIGTVQPTRGKAFRIGMIGVMDFQPLLEVIDPVCPCAHIGGTHVQSVNVLTGGIGHPKAAPARFFNDDAALSQSGQTRGQHGTAKATADDQDRKGGRQGIEQSDQIS